MSKGNKTRGNREAKKPKKIKEKIVAASTFSKGKTPDQFGRREKP